MPFDASFSASASASASFDIGGSPGNSGASGGGIRIPAATQNEPENLLAPLHVFRFHIRFKKDGSEVPVCSGAFAECTGLEATMEPKQIKAGGHNYGTIQRVGRTSFATVVLKRGMTSTRDLWQWFHLVNGQTGYAYRMSVEIDMQDGAGNTVLTWGLAGALPVKFKAADLNAKGTDVGIEELHLAHEGLSLLGGA
ncbi:phage tail protein [Uliginosibacterium sp. H1]|uniref:phage tail protein n=1 Tax=Uliginosibacterium sp. H1 TaxID=3114757 RepID=UPI002E199295|nr:phage tail protein [Uliginosibacterium sp. H1]